MSRSEDEVDIVAHHRAHEASPSPDARICSHIPACVHAMFLSARSPSVAIPPSLPRRQIADPGSAPSAPTGSGSRRHSNGVKDTHRKQRFEVSEMAQASWQKESCRRGGEGLRSADASLSADTKKGDIAFLFFPVRACRAGGAMRTACVVCLPIRSLHRAVGGPEFADYHPFASTPSTSPASSPRRERPSRAGGGVREAVNARRLRSNAPLEWELARGVARGGFSALAAREISAPALPRQRSTCLNAARARRTFPASGRRV